MSNILLKNKPLNVLTWFKTGGSCKYFFQPENKEMLKKFLLDKQDNLDIFPLGAGSNILIRDKGYNGIIVHFAKLNKITLENNGIIRAQAGAMDVEVARFARNHSLSGLEFLVGIPGSIGGGIKMNSGAFGSEFKNVLIDVKAINKDGVIKTFPKNELNLSYRTNKLDSNWFFLDGRFKTKPGQKNNIQKKMKEIISLRKNSQPTGVKTGGSTFMNNENFKAWELIDKSGCRGTRLGGAKISEKHCNFIINFNKANSSEIEALGELVRERVFKKTGVKLNWEIKILGEK